MMKLTVDWTVSGNGTMDVDPCKIEGMTSQEIEDWISDGVHMEVMEQGKFNISIIPIYTPEQLQEEIRKYREDV